MEGVHCVALSHPSMPSAAVSTRYPHELTNSASPVRSFSSSSTIRTFSWVIGCRSHYSGFEHTLARRQAWMRNWTSKTQENALRVHLCSHCLHTPSHVNVKLRRRPRLPVASHCNCRYWIQ